MKLFIYCAGGLGKEVYDLSKEINTKTKRWDEISFIDDIRKEKVFYNAGVYQFKEVTELSENYDLEVIIANGEPYNRKNIYNKIRENRLSLAKLIHPDATILPTVKIGEGVIINKDVTLSSDTVVEDNVLLQSSVIVGHDVILSAHSVISSLSFVGGHCKVGKGVYIAPGVLIRDRIYIGEDSIIGMGSVVVKNIESGIIAYGNPALKVSNNTEHKVFK